MELKESAISELDDIISEIQRILNLTLTTENEESLL